jgi:geranylgeranyl pyrophosphate synthase
MEPSIPTLQTLDPRSLRAGAAADEVPLELSDALDLTLGRHGKGLRPAIVFEAARQGPFPDTPAVELAARAVELLHTATMTHDDILDRGEQRRGEVTAVARYGSHKAATLGIWLLGRSVCLLADCGHEASVYASDSIKRMFFGQLLEVLDLFNVDRTLTSYHEAAAGKTAALFQLSAWLGAKLAGSSTSRVSALERYGLELGIAYQIADDICDLYESDQLASGQAGDDLRMGIYTLPIIYALEDEPQLHDPLTRGLTEESLSKVIAIIREGDGITRAFADCCEHLSAAKRAVGEVQGDGTLFAIADYTAAKCEEAIG